MIFNDTEIKAEIQSIKQDILNVKQSVKALNNTLDRDYGRIIRDIELLKEMLEGLNFEQKIKQNDLLELTRIRANQLNLETEK